MCGGKGKRDFSVSWLGECSVPRCGEVPPVGDSRQVETIAIRVANPQVEALDLVEEFLQRSFLFPEFGMVGIRVASYNTYVPLLRLAVTFSFQLLAHARSSKEDTHVIKGPNR